MRLTLRGRVAVAVVALSVIMGWRFGARSLNAIAAPTLAALLVSAVLLSRSDPPTAALSSVEAGFPGESRTLDVRLSGTGLAVVSLPFPDDVDGEHNPKRTTLPGTLSYDVELAGRGVHELGPPAVELRDPLGLLVREVETVETTDVTVYPRRYRVERGSVLSRFFLDELETERQEFDRLREYQPSDPLRHIHWKSSAKHDEFLVTEFAPSERDETVTIVATAPGGEVDEMSRLAATIADLALEGGYNVELATPDGHVPPGRGSAHRASVFRLLARTGPGTRTPLPVEDADVEITFARRELVVRVGPEEYAVSQLLERVGATGLDDSDALADHPDADSELESTTATDTEVPS